jgi:hypothetical protein
VSSGEWLTNFPEGAPVFFSVIFANFQSFSTFGVRTDYRLHCCLARTKHCSFIFTVDFKVLFTQTDRLNSPRVHLFHVRVRNQRQAEGLNHDVAAQRAVRRDVPIQFL